MKGLIRMVLVLVLLLAVVAWEFNLPVIGVWFAAGSVIALVVLMLKLRRHV